MTFTLRWIDINSPLMIAVYALMSIFRFIEAFNRSVLKFQKQHESIFFFLLLIILQIAILWTWSEKNWGNNMKWTKIPFGTFEYWYFCKDSKDGEIIMSSWINFLRKQNFHKHELIKKGVNFLCRSQFLNHSFAPWTFSIYLNWRTLSASPFTTFIIVMDIARIWWSYKQNKHKMRKKQKCSCWIIENPDWN